MKRETGFSESITPIRFRTTTLTDIQEVTQDLKLTQYSAGHSSPSTTMQFYIKGRKSSAEATAALEALYLPHG